MPTPKLTLADFRQPDKLDAFLDRSMSMPKDSLAAPNIALGYLDGVFGGGAAPLQNAIQNAENASNTQAAERRGLVNERAKSQYAAEGNARNQLLARYNSLEDKITDIQGGYSMVENPELAKSQIANLRQQQAGILPQLTESTERLKAMPHYQGETLVNPTVGQGTAPQAARGQDNEELIRVGKYLSSIFGPMKETNLKNNTDYTESWHDFREKYKEEFGEYPKFSEKDYASRYNDAWEAKRKSGKTEREILDERTKSWLSQQEAKIKALQNSTEQATLDNVQKTMKDLKIKEGSNLWNKGITNASTVETIGAFVQSLGLLKGQPEQPPKKAARGKYQ